ncbi:MAG TPA: phosphotransferase, partial [Fimbriimonas sp.]|nr:phosphotransferase [Fimbriimonas sp.]
VPVPAVDFFVSQDSELGSPFMISQKIEGVTLGSRLKELTPEQRIHIDREIGAILSNLHQVGGSQFGTYLGPHFTTWPEAFMHLVSDLEQDARDASVQLDPGIFTLFDRHAASLESVKEARLVHWDMWDENILIDPATLSITGIVDFERALWGDPLLEWNFITPSATLLEACPHIVLDKDAQIRRSLYSLYLGLILVIETKYRGFNEDHLTWCRGQVAKAVSSLDN